MLKVLKKHKTKLKREHRARKVKDEDRRDKKAQETRGNRQYEFQVLTILLLFLTSYAYH